MFFIFLIRKYTFTTVHCVYLNKNVQKNLKVFGKIKFGNKRKKIRMRGKKDVNERKKIVNGRKKKVEMKEKNKD